MWLGVQILKHPKACETYNTMHSEITCSSFNVVLIMIKI